MKPYMKIKEACEFTGMSQFYLRQAVRNREIDYITSGRTYYINMVALLEKLDKKSKES